MKSENREAKQLAWPSPHKVNRTQSQSRDKPSTQLSNPALTLSCSAVSGQSHPFVNCGVSITEGSGIPCRLFVQLNKCPMLGNMQVDHDHTLHYPLPHYQIHITMRASQQFSKTVILSLSPGNNSVVSGMIFDFYIWDRSEIWKVEAKDAAKDTHRTAQWQSHVTPNGSDGQDKGLLLRDPSLCPPSVLSKQP